MKKALLFTIILLLHIDIFGQHDASSDYVKHNSVLASGEWYKFLVKEDGFYKITYDDLSAWGVNAGNISPRTIKIYGNGGRMLPEANSQARHDDLHEVPIMVVGEEDGKFDNTDYILFYGDGPDEWAYDAGRKMYMYKKNLYTRNSGYFLTFGGNDGIRFAYGEDVTTEAGREITTTMDVQAYEPTEYFISKSGKHWYGDIFDANNRHEFSFDFNNLDDSRKVLLAYAVAAKAYAASSFVVSCNDFSQSHYFRPVGTSLSSHAAYESSNHVEVTPTAGNLTVSMEYNRPNTSAKGWLRYIYLNAHQKLIFNGGTLWLRNPAGVTEGETVNYKIQSDNGSAMIFDITNPVEPRRLRQYFDGHNITFKYNLSDNNHTLVCFDGSDTKSVDFDQKINNQNIHGMDSPEMVIVYHKDFADAAVRLFNYHNNHGLNTKMIDIDLIYNEFSSGVQDVCAIRDMMRYFYKTSEADNSPQYLLLVGDASYDPLDRKSPNTNFVPTYESDETLAPAYSFCSDDFFCFLDDDEGTFGNKEDLDVAVGRLPVQTTEEANSMVDKILHYASNSPEQKGNWRNIVTIACDDADNLGMGYENRHFESAEVYADIIENNFKSFKVNKIYSAAYQQVAAAGGQRYPEVNDAINARIEQGTLVFGYNGHGGELCLALEQIVSIPDINGWSNYDRLTFMVTATCEFSRYDDPERTSAGELVILNPNGGAFGMLTTSRLTDAYTNQVFCKFVYNNMFTKNDNGEYPTVGEFVMKSKNNYTEKGNSFENIAPYVIFGDPAIPINYPKYNSVNITNVSVDGCESDTIRALSKVTVKGNITDGKGSKMETFNGVIFPEFRDKPTTTSTLGNDGEPPMEFQLDKSIIYRGKVNVENGEFSFTFITPKDIAYNFGKGASNFYFMNDEFDGNGYYDNYLVGGNSNTQLADVDGPEITMYINDSDFKNGDMTNENPVLKASIYDFSGLNTTGNGIGHDIIATIDDNTDRTYNLNTYFETELGSYQKGTIEYPIFNLPEGEHTLTIKAWDVCNNSSTSELNFVVCHSNTIKLANLISYPNPFHDHTNFKLNHNQAGNKLDVTLMIFNSNGKIVKQFKSKLESSQFNDIIFRWDGQTDNGATVPQGIYVYKVILTDDKGNLSKTSGKLIKY